jgi:peptide/nickel transport system substrate-binding protein
VRIDANGAVQPALAHRWEIAGGGRALTFHLRDGVRFHDGAAFSATDVKFSLDRARAPDSTNAQKELFAAIAEVILHDPRRVEVRLARPDGGMLFNLAMGDAVIVSPASAARNAVHPVGTGPFALARWARGALVTLKRNADYWGAPPALDGASFAFIADPSAAFAALMAGDVDGFPNFPAPELLPQLERDGRFRVVAGATEGETILAMNNARAPFDDVRVRRALAHAIDRQAIVDGAMFGYGALIGSHFSPAHPAYVDLTALYPYDPRRARALLAEAGFPNGFRARLALPPVGYARRGGEIVAGYLRAVGVEADILNFEWAQWLEQVFTNKDYDLTIVSHTEPNDIGIYARPDYYFNYRSPAFDALIAELSETVNADRRSELLRLAQRRIAEDAVNVFLFELPQLGVWRKDLTGVWANAPVQANDLTRAHWAPSA